MDDKKEKKPSYYFNGPLVNARVAGGGLASLKPGPAQAGMKETEFVLPGQTFGAVDIVWQQDNKEGSKGGNINPGSNWEDTPPCYDGLYGSFASSARDGTLDVDVCFALKNDAIIQTVQIKNISDAPVTLMDVSYSFHGNADFKFGNSIGDKVIGHHFISDHGSHLLFIRCDGLGPYMLIMPQDGTKLEYFDQGAESAPGAGHLRGGFRAYALSAAAVKKAEGSVMPTPGSSMVLEAGKTVTHRLKYVWAANNADARKQLVAHGLLDIDVAPGLTVPAGSLVSMSVKGLWDDIEFEYPKEAEPISKTHTMTPTEAITKTASPCCSVDASSTILKFKLNKLGENKLAILYDKGRRRMDVTFFVTQDIKTLIQKRGAFIAAKQHKDESLWYNGLLAEHNNRTGALLGPDNYDDIGGWRIYEVTCDDPGLSKPAFLSGKLAEYPVAEEVAALDLYIEKFVWGGLQNTTEEAYPYGIYGIPDWKQNRESKDEGLGGKLHIWRIYDYPHIAITYFNMYRIARDFPNMPLTHDAITYLVRARDTAIAMFTIPMDLTRWDARNTGLYNEICYEDIIEALKTEGLKYDQLQRHWDRKSHYFAVECTDLFGSEYPFDTTGFESTHILAKRALKLADSEVKENQHRPPLTRELALRFMENQMACNIATRGVLEPAYYWYGSDYRSNNTAYTLSYMSQMGGWAILDYALYYASNPYELLRLGYGSLLSSWALVNTGYWFPKDQHDGAACGGFEPLSKSKTWLGQDLLGGPWYYSCEIDLGFCGALRGAATILAQDPEFGLICYGGTLDGNKVTCEDGINRRFHMVMPEGRMHITMDKGRFKGPITLDDGKVSFKIDPRGVAGNITLCITSDGYGGVQANDAKACDGEELVLTLPCDGGVQAVDVLAHRLSKPPCGVSAM